MAPFCKSAVAEWVAASPTPRRFVSTAEYTHGVLDEILRLDSKLNISGKQSHELAFDLISNVAFHQKKTQALYVPNTWVDTFTRDPAFMTDATEMTFEASLSQATVCDRSAGTGTGTGTGAGSGASARLFVRADKHLFGSECQNTEVDNPFVQLQMQLPWARVASHADRIDEFMRDVSEAALYLIEHPEIKRRVAFDLPLEEY
jgi:hypothetical protein